MAFPDKKFHKSISGPYDTLLVCDTGRAVVSVNDAAAPESVLCKSVLHRDIVRVCISPEVVYALPAPVEACIGYPSLTAAGCKPVYRAVRSWRKPCPLLYQPVCGVFPYDEAECAGYVPAPVSAHKAVRSRNLRKEKFP